MATDVSKTRSFSVDSVLKLRSEAFATIRIHASRITTIGTAIESLDQALQTSLAVRCVDDQQAVIVAARALQSLLNEGGDE